MSSRRQSPRAVDTSWFRGGYLGVAGFFALEAATREPGTASSLDASSDDQGTTRTIVTAYALALSSAPMLRRVPSPRLPRVAGPIGLALEGGGLGLRVWSMRTLRAAFSRTLRTEAEQRVIDDGPYQFVRHPGYAGSLLTWIGFALTSGSLPVVVLVSALLGRAYHRRIAAEEQLLRRELPSYVAYSDRTKKLIPFMW